MRLAQFFTKDLDLEAHQAYLVIDRKTGIIYSSDYETYVTAKEDSFFDGSYGEFYAD